MKNENSYDKIKEYKQELIVLKEQLDKLIDLNIQGFVPLDMFEKKYNDLTYRIDELEGRIKKLSGDDDSENKFNEKIRRLNELVKEKAENWIQI